MERGPHASQVESDSRDVRTRLDRLGDLHEHLARLVGSAESADGRIRAECTVAAVPAKLEIDPGAMRLGPRELAETISGVIHAASTDLRQQLREAMNRRLGGNDLDEARSRANEALAAYRRAASDDRRRL